MIVGKDIQLLLWMIDLVSEVTALIDRCYLPNEVSNIESLFLLCFYSVFTLFFSLSYLCFFSLSYLCFFRFLSVFSLLLFLFCASHIIWSRERIR